MKILRILPVFVVVSGVFVFGAAFPAEAGQIKNQVLEVSVQRANVRDAPSLQGEVIFQVSRDEVLKVIQKEGDWYWVENSTGRRGYISNTVVRVVAVRASLRSEPNVPAPLPSILQKPSSGTFRSSDVIAMAKAGLSDSIIVAAIKQSDSTEFDLSPAGLIALKDGGVSEMVIQAIINRSTPQSGVTQEVSSVKESLRESDPPPALQQAGTDKVDWQRRLDLAQVKRSRGVRYVFVGLGMGAGGMVIAATGGLSSSGPRVVGGLTALGGAGVFWYGIYNWLKGGNEVDNLDREGRSKGYLTLVPTDGGVRLAVNFSF